MGASLGRVGDAKYRRVRLGLYEFVHASRTNKLKSAEVIEIEKVLGYQAGGTASPQQ